MTMRETVRPVLRGSAVLAVALLAACTPPATHPTAVATPTACEDPSYLKLRQQNPDSLTERAWERLQTLDRECATARRRAYATHRQNGMSHGGYMMGAGIVATVIMVAMMVSMW